MIPKSIIVLFASFIFGRQCTPEDVIPNVAVPATASTVVGAPDVLAEIAGNVAGKGENLVEEIDQIGKQMQPGALVAQQETNENNELRINDEFDMKQKIENFTLSKLKTTEKVMTVTKEQDVPIDGEGLENEEAGPDPEDTYQIRPANENEFVEFSDTVKDRKTHGNIIEEHIVPSNPEVPENPVKAEFHQEDFPKPGKPFEPEIIFRTASSRAKEISGDTEKHEDIEAEKEEVGPTRPPLSYPTRRSETPEVTTSETTKEVPLPTTPSGSTEPEVQESDQSKLPENTEAGPSNTQEIDPPVISQKPSEELSTSSPQSKQLKEPELSRTDNFIADVSDGGIPDEHEGFDKEEKEEERKEEEDADWISWDVVHFLLLLSPYDEDEVTWWTIIFEAVKCSLRNCPNKNTYWHHSPVHLPRITRHRREISDFDPETAPTTAKPCACRDLENYFEKLYESMKERSNNSTM